MVQKCTTFRHAWHMSRPFAFGFIKVVVAD